MIVPYKRSPVREFNPPSAPLSIWNSSSKLTTGVNVTLQRTRHLEAYKVKTAANNRRFLLVYKEQRRPVSENTEFLNLHFCTHQAGSWSPQTKSRLFAMQFLIFSHDDSTGNFSHQTKLEGLC